MKLEFEVSFEDTRDILRAAGMVLLAAAVTQEMRKPAHLRTWHGAVADVVPYDFRAPTLERVRDSYWNPNNPDLFTPTAFGVGWAVNVPTLMRNLNRLVQEGFAEMRQHLGSRL